MDETFYKDQKKKLTELDYGIRFLTYLPFSFKSHLSNGLIVKESLYVFYFLCYYYDHGFANLVAVDAFLNDGGCVCVCVCAVFVNL